MAIIYTNMATINTYLLILAFTTVCHSAEDSLRFIVIGDNGGQDTFPFTTPIQRGTAARMAKLAEAVGGIDFVLELGDNFYNYGIRDVDDERFQLSFENVYYQPSLQVPFYMIAGNHDHIGNVSAEIAYTKMSNKWRFPDFYYPLSFKIPNSSASIEFAMIDTVRLCGIVVDEISLHPMGPKDPVEALTQWGWIEERLKNSNATYLFTAGHYPVYSIAEHGPTQCLVDLLLPKLSMYRASGHMSGHDHNLQHLQDNKDGVTLDFILSGCADKMDASQKHKDKVPEGVSKFHWADGKVAGGFVYVEASTRSMVSHYMDANGNTLYNVTTYPRTQH